ncbi:hypothetical protein SASPL_128440 [Salvia splendens]|uniref:Wall-associated receptor kinase galacturonan-binding domain-containing protein n=1 Tax=Salvia splendens TaxID=180675 RepID=A0A8X8ZMH5_SALSN|nr:hypothetical protein SASPL_128440 [Salvia splendens]
MTLASILGFIFFLALTTATTSQEISRQGCDTRCGNLTIRYPLGVGPGCSLNSSFAITCDNTTAPPTPFLTSINRQVLNISMHGVVIVNQPVSPINCSRPRLEDAWPSVKPIPSTTAAATVSTAARPQSRKGYKDSNLATEASRASTMDSVATPSQLTRNGSGMATEPTQAFYSTKGLMTIGPFQTSMSIAILQQHAYLSITMATMNMYLPPDIAIAKEAKAVPTYLKDALI